MAFIDILALEECLILMAAVFVGYTGALATVAMVRRDPAGLRATLKGASAPFLGIGAIATLFGVWGEVVWPYPAPYLTAYNILFNDVFLLFGMTMVALGVSLALGLRLQYAGLFALVAGGVTMAYGWNGYVLGMTKEPLYTLLLFGAYGLAGLLAFPTAFMTDLYLENPDGSAFTLAAAAPHRRSVSIQASARAVQPVAPGVMETSPAPTFTDPIVARVPLWVTGSMIAFVVSAGLAAFAALYFLDSTMPAHLASPP